MHHGQIFRFCRKVPFVSQHPFLPLQLLYQLLYPKYQIEPTPHKLLWLTWSLLNTCIFMLTVLYFYRYSCFTNFCAQGPGRACPSQATVADMVVAKYMYIYVNSPIFLRGARWLSGRVSDSGARGPGFETYRRRVVSLSKTLYSPKVLVNYPGSDGSVPT